MLKLKKNIVLIGHMGSGKTSLGRNISKLLKKEFIDTDEEIEKKIGISINKIFSEYGEKKFRELEEKIILKILQSQIGSIISLGGGSLESVEIRNLVFKKHISVWLKCDLSILAKRLENSKKRPLLFNKDTTKELSKLNAKRMHNYEKSIIHCDVSKKQKKIITEEIIKDIIRINEN